MAANQTFMLNPTQLTDILFAASRIDDLRRIVEEGAWVATSTSIDKVSLALQEKTGISTEDVKKLIGVVLDFIATRETRHVSTREVAEGVLRSLAKAGSTSAMSSPSPMDTWQAAEMKVCQIIDSISSGHPFHILRKAEGILNAHQNIMTGVRIVTDLRPVFDETGTKILHSVVSHKMIISYNDGLRGRRIELGIDANDLAEIRRVADKAQVKGVTIQESLKGVPPWSVSLQMDD